MGNSSATTNEMKTILKGVSIVFVGFVISKIFHYLFRISIARYFGVEQYGTFALAMSVINLAMVFALIGINIGLIRYISEYSAKDDKKKVVGLFKTGTIIVSITSVAVALMIILLTPFIASGFSENQLLDYLFIMSFSLPFTAFMYLSISVFQSYQKLKYQVITENVTLSVMKIVFIIIFIFLGFEFLSIPLAFTLSSVVSALIALYLLNKRFFSLRDLFKKHDTFKRKLIVFSLPLLFTNFMFYIFSWTDTIMLGIFNTAEVVGLYNAAVPTAQLLGMVPIAFGAIFFPVITRTYTKKKINETRKLFNTTTKWIFFINLPLFLVLLIFPRKILEVIFGPEFIFAATPLSVLAIGIFLLATFGQPCNHVLSMLERTKRITYATTVSAIVNFILNLVLIPQYDMLGAAIASLIASITSLLILFYYTYSGINANQFSIGIIKALAACSISAILIYNVSLILGRDIFTLAFILSVFLIIYIALLNIFKTFDEDDKEIMFSAVNKAFKSDRLNTLIRRLIR